MADEIAWMETEKRKKKGRKKIKKPIERKKDTPKILKKREEKTKQGRRCPQEERERR